MKRPPWLWRRKTNTKAVSAGHRRGVECLPSHGAEPRPNFEATTSRSGLVKGRKRSSLVSAVLARFVRELHDAYDDCFNVDDIHCALLPILPRPQRSCVSFKAESWGKFASELRRLGLTSRECLWISENTPPTLLPCAWRRRRDMLDLPGWHEGGKRRRAHPPVQVPPHGESPAPDSSAPSRARTDILRHAGKPRYYFLMTSNRRSRFYRVPKHSAEVVVSCGGTSDTQQC